MKIGFYAPLKPISHPNVSGDREIAREIVSELEKNGHEIIIISEFRTRFFYQSLKGWLKFIRAFLNAFSKVKGEKIDCFFTYHMYYKAPDPIGWLLSLLLRKPYFIYEAMYSRRPSKKREYVIGYWLARWALKRASSIFSNKSDDYPNLLKLLPEEKVSYIPPAVDVDKFKASTEKRDFFRVKHNISSEAIVISSVAMLRPDRKTEGVLFLLDALSNIKDQEFVWCHAGDGVGFEEVELKAQRVIPEGNFRMLGAIDRLRLLELYSASDIFAFPGIDEGFGLVYLEAQSFELPVVAIDNGGIPDAVVKDESAFLTPLGDVAAYAKALKELLESKDLREKMGKKGRAHVVKNHDKNKNYKAVNDRICALCR